MCGAQLFRCFPGIQLSCFDRSPQGRRHRNPNDDGAREGALADQGPRRAIPAGNKTIDPSGCDASKGWCDLMGCDIVGRDDPSFCGGPGCVAPIAAAMPCVVARGFHVLRRPHGFRNSAGTRRQISRLGIVGLGVVLFLIVFITKMCLNIIHIYIYINNV